MTTIESAPVALPTGGYFFGSDFILNDGPEKSAAKCRNCDEIVYIEKMHTIPMAPELIDVYLGSGSARIIAPATDHIMPSSEIVSALKAGEVRVVGYYCNDCMDSQPEDYKLFREWLSQAWGRVVVWRDSGVPDQLAGIQSPVRWAYIEDKNDPDVMVLSFGVTAEGLREETELTPAHWVTTSPAGLDADGNPCASFMFVGDEVESLEQAPTEGIWHSYADWLAERRIAA